MIYFKSAVDRIVEAKDMQIKTLERELSRQKEISDFERKRADRAIDQIIAMNGARPVTPPPVRNPEIERIIEKELVNLNRAGREFGEEPK